ncbi:MAG: hypothetical protein ABIX28_15550 [Vicinamibacterales bacterium]
MIRRAIYTGMCSVAALAVTASLALAQAQTSRAFSGAKVNGGTVTTSSKDGRTVLTLSDDFKVPDTPDPHWQVVDSKGNTYLLQRLGVKSLGGLVKDRVNMSITVPGYIKDVAKVQIYCAWAEAVLGEAPFAAPQMTMNK